MTRIIKRLSELSTVERSSKPSRVQDSLEGRPKDTNRGLILGSRVGSKNKILWIVTSIALAVPRQAFACAACTGRSDDAAAVGLNVAVFTLLVVLLMVYGALVSFLVYLIRRAAKCPLAIPEVQKGVV